MVKVRIPAPLRPKADGQTEVTVNADHVDEAIHDLVSEYPDLQENLLDEDGELQRFVNFFVNGTNISELSGTETKVNDEDTLLVLPAVAGGDSTSHRNGGEDSGSLTPDELRFYGRHLILPDVGQEGQERLKRSSALVIGAGGLGSPTLLYLAAAGVGRIGIVDPDTVNASNLHRQILYGYDDEGKKKVHAAKQRLEALNPHITVEAHDARFTSENALDLVERYDVVIDGTDNFPARYLANDASVLAGKPNVHASIFRFEGQASVFWPDNEGPCYRCLYPQPPPPGLVPSCAEGGVLGVLPGTLGVLQATEAIKILLGTGTPLTGRLVLYNARDGSFDQVDIEANPDCPVCGDDPSLTELIDYEAFCGLDQHDEALNGNEVDVETLARRQNDEGLVLLDVREDWEREIVRIGDSLHVPLADLPDRVSELPVDKDIVVYCKMGGRSAKAVEFLQSVGLDAYNLAGGVDAWSEEIEEEQPAY